MGKIRIKAFGSPEEEAKQKEKVKARKEAKKARIEAENKKAVKAAPPQEEKKIEAVQVEEKEKATTKSAKVDKEKKTKPAEEKESAKKIKRVRGKRYQNAAKAVEKKQLYPLSQAVELAQKTSFAHFDSSIEAHLLTLEKGISGEVKLPHGTGKELKIAICDDKILTEIAAGKINFDVLIATPDIMPKLARFAKLLGPRGLMPNPKAGTVTDKPDEIVKKLQSGLIRFKTESGAPLIHLIIGKTSFPQKHLEENLSSLINAVGRAKIKKMTLSSTMGPGIKVDLNSI
ncbi:hypothetical protein HY439_03680 [Candidatus Microgenomates bacterium]|nr:hypothetical protein [Candidatus Microgenomates bacterium]